MLLEVDHLYLTAVPAHEEEYVSAVRGHGGTCA
jgi:hypothetical protein